MEFLSTISSNTCTFNINAPPDMSWSTRIQTSWQLLLRSLQIVRSNPRLWLFPIISTVCAVALALFFFAPIIALGFATGFKGEQWENLAERFNAVFYAYGVVIYLVSMFLTTFMNVAFYHEILRALAGHPVSVRHGLQFALTKLPAIAFWSLLAATVGLIIRMIEERLGWIGKIVMAIVGAVWSVASVFAIPVLIRSEETNPLAVLRGSVATVKQTWGESLVGFVGLRAAGILFFLVSLVYLGLTAAGFVFLHSPILLAVALVVWVLAMVVWSVLIAIATHVYRCALYVYASEGVVPGPYTADLLNAGWKVKKA